MKRSSLFPEKFRATMTAQQRWQAAVSRRAATAEEVEEPTTSFKTALIVVILLHVIAAGGILKFESIKASRAVAAPAPTAAVPAPTAAPRATPDPVKQPVAVAPPPRVNVKDSGTLYTVAKGDTLLGIARTNHVSYDELLKLNQISDPKKLQIGQKLKLPAKSRTS